jgi:hypothetical protein
MFVWILVGLGLVGVAKSGKHGAKVITSGSTLLRKGKTYRVEMTATGGVVDDPNQRAAVAEAIEGGLKNSGAYDIYISPTIPMIVSYSIRVAGDTPLMLALPAQQTINGVEATYTFTSIQQIAAAKAA